MLDRVWAGFGAFAAILILGAAAQAWESDWNAGTLARMRLLATDAAMSVAGPTEIAIEIAIPEGWKTYWRVAGPSGIATNLDWSGSQNVQSVDLVWPVPSRMIDPSIPWLGSIGYRGGMTLLARVAPIDRNEPIVFALEAELGVCDDVCIVDYVTGQIVLGPARQSALIASDPFAAVRRTLIAENGDNDLRIEHVRRSRDAVIVEARSAGGFDDPDLFVDTAETACNEKREFAARETQIVRFRLPDLCGVGGVLSLTLIDRGKGVAASLPVDEMQ